MPSSLVLTCELALRWVFENNLDIQSPKDQTNLRKSNQFDDGTGESQINELWTDRRLVTAASPTDDIDLSGVLKNVFGRTVNFTAIKAIGIFNMGHPDGAGGYTDTAGEDILVGGAGSGNHAWAPLFNSNSDAKLSVESGSMFFLTSNKAGIVVIPGAQDVLRIVHNGTVDIAYQIVLAGVI